MPISPLEPWLRQVTSDLSSLSQFYIGRTQPLLCNVFCCGGYCDICDCRSHCYELFGGKEGCPHAPTAYIATENCVDLKELECVCALHKQAEFSAQVKFLPVFNQPHSQWSGQVAREYAHRYFALSLKHDPFALDLGTCEKRRHCQEIEKCISKCRVSLREQMDTPVQKDKKRKGMWEK